MEAVGTLIERKKISIWEGSEIWNKSWIELYETQPALWNLNQNNDVLFILYVFRGLDVLFDYLNPPIFTLIWSKDQDSEWEEERKKLYLQILAVYASLNLNSALLLKNLQLVTRYVD